MTGLILHCLYGLAIVALGVTAIVCGCRDLGWDPDQEERD